jgi:hypothetical protein
MVHTNPEFETPNLILDFEFDQHLESHKHVINIIIWFRDMRCYKSRQDCFQRVNGVFLFRIHNLSLYTLNKKNITMVIRNYALPDFLVPSRGGPCGAAVCAAGFRVVFAPPLLSASQKRLRA